MVKQLVSHELWAVVEPLLLPTRSFAWLHRNRCLLVRFERRDARHQAFLSLCCALMCTPAA